MQTAIRTRCASRTSVDVVDTAIILRPPSLVSSKSMTSFVVPPRRSAERGGGRPPARASGVYFLIYSGALEGRPPRLFSAPGDFCQRARAGADSAGTAFAVTVPYYEFREVLSVRTADAARFRSLADLRGRRVGTLGGTIAYEILRNAERNQGIEAVSYDDDVHPYSDLVLGRLDAVLL